MIYVRIAEKMEFSSLGGQLDKKRGRRMPAPFEVSVSCGCSCYASRLSLLTTERSFTTFDSSYLLRTLTVRSVMNGSTATIAM